MSYIILVNEGVLFDEDKNVFERDELDNIMNDWSNGESLVDEDGEVYSIDDLIGNCKIDLYVGDMVEMGDDFVSVCIVELNK